MIAYDNAHPPPPEGQEPNPATYMQGTSAIANVNRILVGGALRSGFVVGYALLPLGYLKPLMSDSLSYRLPKMCKATSLRVISSRRVEIPTGNYCDSFTGIDGTSLSKFKAISIKNNVQVLNMISLAMVKNGGIELANGAVISDEKERQVLMEDMTRFLSEGASTFFFECVIQRPFQSLL